MSKFFNCIYFSFTKKIGFAFLLLIIFGPAQSQDSLSLKRILALGLERNYSILVTRNEEEITKNNLRFAKYAFFPTAVASGRQSTLTADSKQVPFVGAVREVDNAETKSLTGNVTLDWRVFDGMAMFVEYGRIKQLSELGKLNTRMDVENLSAQIATEYFNLLRQIQMLESMRIGMNLSAERLAIASEKYKIGNFSRLEFLQAQGDFNADSSQYLRQEETVTTSKLNLSRILAYNISIPSNWSDTIVVEKSLVLEQLLKSTLDKNTTLLIANQNQALSELDIKAIRSRYYPSISLTAGYSYSDTKAEIGFAKTSHSTGITYGATVSWTLFNRFENRRQITNAKIAMENRELQFESLKLEITSELNQVWNNYVNNLRILSLEKQNLASARENLDIALTRYRLGSLAGIEMREIQNNFLSASNRFINAQYLAKVAEITLKQISGNIEEYF